MSNSNKPIEQKKSFIIYFLDNYQLAVRESVWILNILKKSTELLDKISFVDNCQQSKIGIIMKTRGESGFDISYYAEGRFISKDATSIYRFFDSLSKKNNLAVLDVPEIHIQLQFPKKYSDEYYHGIRTPFIEDKQFNNFVFDAISEQEIDAFLESIQQKVLITFFQQKIDQALDTKNKELFFQTLIDINEHNIPSKLLFEEKDSTTKQQKQK